MRWLALTMLFSFVLLGALFVAASAQQASLPPFVGPRNKTRLIYSRQEDGQIRISCPDVTGLPKPTVSWRVIKYGSDKVIDFSNTQLFAQDETTNNLIFVEQEGKFLTAEHSGEFYCSASNTVGTAFSTKVKAIMKIFDAPSQPNEVPRTAMEGQAIQLRAPANKEDRIKPIEKQYYSTSVEEGDIELVNEERFFVDELGNLNIMRVDLEDNGKKYRYCGGIDAQVACLDIYTLTVTANDGSGSTEVELLSASGYIEGQVGPSEITLIKGREGELACVFSGPDDVPKVSWIPMAGAKVEYSNPYKRKIFFKPAREDHAGKYKCQGIDSNNKMAVHSFDVKVEVIPEWSSPEESLRSANVTDGKPHSFYCKTYAKPSAVVTWSINGDTPEKWATDKELGSANRPQVNGDTMKFDAVNKDMLMAVSCEATNNHGSLVGNAYLSIVSETQLEGIEPTTADSTSIKLGDGVTFKCRAKVDLLFDVKWFWEQNGKRVSNMPDVFTINNMEGPGEAGEDYFFSELTVKTEVDDLNEEFNGEYMCIADTGHDRKNTSWHLRVTGEPVPKPVTQGGIPYWVWIIVVLAVIILIIVIVVCCCCMRRGGGDSYRVDEKERKAGHDPEQELKDTGYHDYERPPPYEDNVPGNLDLEDDDKPLDSDTDSMGEYGDIDTGKFNEDGSFIGQYGSQRKKKQPKTADSMV